MLYQDDELKIELISRAKRVYCVQAFLETYLGKYITVPWMHLDFQWELNFYV